MAGSGSPDGDEASATERPLSFIEQARRRQIVQAAIETLAELGYTNTTFARIAERADISPSLISYHFATKQALLAAVLTSVIEAIDASLTADLEGAPDHPTALRILIESSVRFFATRSTEMLAMEQLFGQGLEPAVAATAQDHHDTMLIEMEDMFREGQAIGEFGDFPTRPMAVTLQAALEAIPAELLAQPDTDIDAYAAALADLFVNAASAGAATT